MALELTMKTPQGEVRRLYVRLIVSEDNNHGEPARALFRSFLTKEAFKAGHHYVHEEEISFHADVDQPLWRQAYDAFRERWASAHKAYLDAVQQVEKSRLDKKAKSSELALIEQELGMPDPEPADV